MTVDDTTIASEVLSASLGGAISASILYPLEVLKTKMQAADGNDEGNDDGNEGGDDKDKKKTTAPAATAGMIPTTIQLYQNHGISVFIRGIETSAFQSAIEKALYFFAYTALKDGYSALFLNKNRNNNNEGIGAVSNLLLGCMAEWIHLPISLPIDAWTTQIQTSTIGATPMQILLTMLASPNKLSWYKGISTYYVLCFKPALQYTVYEQVKKVMVSKRQNKTLSAVEAFILGMIARTVATVLVFPFIRAKVLLQKHAINVNPETETATVTADSVVTTSTSSSSPTRPTSTNDDDENNLTMVKVLWRTLHKQGLVGLYQGLGPELTRGIFSAALMLMIKERVAGTVRKMLMSSTPKNSKSALKN